MGSLKDKCRVCFKEQSGDDDRKALFSDDGKELVIAGKLSHILGTAAIKPQQPSTVCVTCSTHIDFCLQFVSRARRVHDHIESGSDSATIQSDIQYRFPVLSQEIEVRAEASTDFFETAGSFFSNVPASMLDEPAASTSSKPANEVDFIVEVEPNDFFADSLASPNRGKPTVPKKVRRILPRPTQDIQVKQEIPHHQQVMIPITLKTPCKMCGVTIVASSMQELKNHVCCGVTASVNPLCLEGGCKKAFSSKHSLRAHQRSAHGMHRKATVPAGKPRNKYACGFEGCSKSYSNMTYLTEHERVHTGERPFSCGNCGKSFYRILDLKKHKLLKVCK